MQLIDLVKDIDGIKIIGSGDVEIKNISSDSRECEEGTLFVALQGSNNDGYDFIDHAVGNGASALLTESEAEQKVPTLCIESETPKQIVSQICKRFYGEHPEHILAVTGTNGKSSAVHFVREILHKLGKKAGSIGTLGVVDVEGNRQRGSLTTPGIIGLHQQLAELKKQGAEYAVMEASSHGLHQERLSGIIPEVAGFTNLSHDHLDYHGTLEHYFDAKLKLFTEVMQNGVAVLNSDIKEFKTISKKIGSQKIISYGKNGDLKLVATSPELDGMTITFEDAKASYDISTKLIGEFQAYNLLCAIGMVEALGIPMVEIVKACENISAVKGRMDIAAFSPVGAPVIVDYAHTPEALETVLMSLRPHVKGKLVVIFGCGGERDKEKRPEMGKIAKELADVVIVTDDNSRMEKAVNIRQEIIAACPEATEIANRKEAIAYGVSLLEEGDMLLIAGKGHEDYQIIGRRKYRFDDGEIARRAIGSPLWDATDVVSATKGTTKNTDWTAYGVSIDSRTIKRGDLFIALKGEAFDGHDYVAEALEKGAVAAIIQKKPSGVKDDSSLIKVTNTQKALNDLAVYRRNQSEAKTVAVTGSVGKTGVKDAIAVILGYQARTHSTQGNLNNSIGLPLSMARLPLDCKYAVYEIGMSNKGEIKPLVAMLKPDVSVITAIEEAHMQNFKSIVEVANAKAEIFESTNKDGTVVLPYDSSLLTYLAAKAHKLGIKNIVSFGVGEFANYRLVKGREYSDGIKLVANFRGNDFRFKIGLLGRHNAINAMAVMAAIEAIGGDLGQAARTYIKVRASQGRGRIHRVRIGGNRITMIDDSYNACPSSMAAAIDVLSSVGYDTRGRLVAVLGDMLELGKNEVEYHKSLADLIAENKVDVVLTSGGLMKNLHSSLPQDVDKRHVEKPDELLGVINEVIKRGDVILLKGSHGSNLWQVAESLKAGEGN